MFIIIWFVVGFLSAIGFVYLSELDNQSKYVKKDNDAFNVFVLVFGTIFGFITFLLLVSIFVTAYVTILAGRNK